MKNARKKILFVITKSNWGGAQRYVYDIATSLPSNEYEVAVALGGEGLLLKKLKEHGITVFQVQNFQRNVKISKEFRAFFEILKIYKKFFPDIVHLNSSKAGGIGALAARIAGVRSIIFTAHGWPFWESRNCLQKSAIAFLSFLSIVLSTTTICISEHDSKVFEHIPFVRKKIRVIRNGIAPYPLLDRTTARKTLFDETVISEHGQDLWVLTVAEFTANKDLFSAIEAVHLHNQSSSKKIFLSLMGDGELKQKIEEYIITIGAQTYIKLLGFVENGRSMYRAFDVLMLTSRKEGVPYVILESGIAEIPCVATAVGGIPEIIKDGKNGFVRPPGDVYAIANALQKLSESAQLCSEMAKSNHSLILKNYSLKNMQEQTLGLYNTHKKTSTN